MRSTRKVRQSPRLRSQATRYQRRGVCTSRCGSTSRVVSPSRPGYRSRSRRWSRQAAASVVSRSGSTRSAAEPGPASATVVAWKALIRCRSRDGSICCSLVSARSAVSSSPATLPVVGGGRGVAPPPPPGPFPSDQLSLRSSLGRSLEHDAVELHALLVDGPQGHRRGLAGLPVSTPAMKLRSPSTAPDQS
jgi:hypothetical protein